MAHRAPLLAVLFLFLATPLLVAQTSEKAARPGEKKPTPQKTNTKVVKSEEVDALQAQQRIVAISLLEGLAINARSFRDMALRARVEARAADAFWETDQDRARELFRRAWDEASAADSETNRLRKEDAQRQLRTSGSVVMRGARDLRSEVLRLVAKRDRALGEEFLKKLTEEDEKAKTPAADSELNPFVTPEAISKRLQLARRLLQDGEVDRAMQFAAPALESITREAIFFLSALREKNAPAADQGFMTLLARAERDPASDANTVSGLSSYAFTPFLYVVFIKDGANTSQERRETPAPDLPENVRNSFFRVATEILLRPLLPPEQDTTTSGRNGKFMVIRRLLPLFEQYAAEQAQLLKTQMAALAGDIPQEQRTGENRSITAGLVDEEPDANALDRMQDRLDRARTSEERDGIYADYAVALSGKGDPKGRELIDKIENAELRKSVRGYVDFQMGQQAVSKGDALEAARLAKSGELTSIQRIWLYTRAARALMKSDRPRASELLEDAAAEARRIGGSSPDRARGLIAVATIYLQSDRVRAWEYVNEALKAANASEGFTGEDSSVSSVLRARNMVMMATANAEEFDLLGLFRGLSKDDFNRAVEMAKSFTGEGPRAVATLAIARAALEKNSQETPSL
jgi:hypothetical protein